MQEIAATSAADPLKRLWPRRLYRAAVLVVFVLHFFASFHTVANFWQWGHAGFNGAGFFQGARNSLRHEMVVQTPYYTGLETPGPGEYYTDHPMAVHFHMIGLSAIFGSGEWVGRLVPTFYSFATLFILFFLLRREVGRPAALLGIALYAATPLHQIFASMIDHEQGCIFWLLLCIHATYRWLDKSSPGWFATAALSISFATQFDWPAYYMSFFLMLYVAFVGLKQSSPAGSRLRAWLRWRRHYTWAAIFSAVVLANFFGFFGWIAAIRGGIGAMIHAFFWRSAEQTGYLQVLFEREQDLHGWLLYSLGAAWLISATWRLFARKLERIDLLPALFLVTQLIHSTVFSQAGKIHCYWTYYLGPFFAVAGAVVLLRVWRFAQEKLQNRSGARFVFNQTAVGVTLIALLAQGLWTAKQQRWGFRSGTAAYVQHYDDGYDLATWGRELSARFPREKVYYLIHKSLFRPRLEFEFYLDAPKKKQGHLGTSAQLIRKGKQPVLLLDLNRPQQTIPACPASRRRHVGQALCRHGSLTAFKGAQTGCLCLPSPGQELALALAGQP
ncbi:MAG: glycosyltransferase family 39 protein [Deltaproteobacteria bacterium]|nr:glycosyltransferase family 39 protein [Deltaproteobacteria bacterium]